jgi:hypothetical protein
MLSANSLRIVPAAALAGLVAPMISRLASHRVLAFQHLHHHRAARS